MPWSRRSLTRAELYLILDADVCGYDKLFEILKRSVNSGVDIVQLRDKHGSAQDTLRFACKAVKLLRGRIPFIINDRLDIAVASKAAGVHLGQDDMPVKEARKILGGKYLIGASCQTMAHVIKAQHEGADYIGFGSVFKTLTKPERRPMDHHFLQQVCAKARVPLFAIGGISVKNVSQLTTHGIRRVAVCRDICLSRDIPRTVRQLKDILKS